MSTFGFLSSVVCRDDIQTQETSDMFTKIAEYFGQIYRSYLEKHIQRELTYHKGLGLFDKYPIERLITL